MLRKEEKETWDKAEYMYTFSKAAGRVIAYHLVSVPAYSGYITSTTILTNPLHIIRSDGYHWRG
jgi:hypothetical protein